MTKTDPDEEISLPKQTVVRMAQELLPEGLNLSRETHDLIVAFAHEFIHMVTFQANEICQRETRNGYIALHHVVRACEELGFPDYVDEIEEVTEIYDRQLKQLQKKKAQKIGWWVKSGEMDDLAVMQAQMLERSKQRLEQLQLTQVSREDTI